MNLFRPSRPVLDGLGNVLRFDGVTVFQVGDGQRQLEDAVEGAGGEVKLFHGGLEQALRRVFDVAELPYLGGRHLGVTGQSRSLETFELPGTCGAHSGLHFFRCFAESHIGQFFVIDMWHLDEYIHPVDERPADAPLVA